MWQVSALLLPPRPRRVLRFEANSDERRAELSAGSADGTRGSPIERRLAASDRPPFRILVVDDDRLMTEFLPRRLRKAMHPSVEILTATTPGEARAIIESMTPHVVLSDYNLRETETGLDILRHAEAHAPDAARILFSGHARAEIRGLDGALIHGYLEKPMKLDELIPPLIHLIRESTGVNVASEGPARGA